MFLPSSNACSYHPACRLPSLPRCSRFTMRRCTTSSCQSYRCETRTTPHIYIYIYICIYIYIYIYPLQLCLVYVRDSPHTYPIASPLGQPEISSKRARSTRVRGVRVNPNYQPLPPHLSMNRTTIPFLQSR